MIPLTRIGRQVRGAVGMRRHGCALALVVLIPQLPDLERFSFRAFSRFCKVDFVVSHHFTKNVEMDGAGSFLTPSGKCSGPAEDTGLDIS